MASIDEMIASRTDLWGDAAMRQTDGASYEFFKDLMPPVRWVNAEFKHYPIVLSASRAQQKARLVSNGSAINAAANKPPMWYNVGVPVKFFVGQGGESFGNDLSRLETPTYLDGCLPVVAIDYKSDGTIYREEVFAPVDDASAAHGLAMVRFSIPSNGNKPGRVEARIESKSKLRARDREVLDEKGQTIVAFSSKWQWDAKRNALVAILRANEPAELAIFTKPAAPGISMSGAIYDERREWCIREWKETLSLGTQLATPEPMVNDAWRSLVIGNLMIAVGDRPHYSAHNAYDHLYEGECGDTLRSLLLFGQANVGPAMLKPMLEFPRQDTRFHVAGQKLQLLSYFYWLTRDTKTVRAYETLWRQALNLILDSREPDSGLLPKDNYAGDIHDQVYSLNSNANCWRGLRDLATVLEDMGEKDDAGRIREQASEYRKAILKAVERSIRRETNPPYIPIGLLANEKAPDPLTSTELGSYYDLICPYMICSEIFGQGSKEEDWLIGYLQKHGGIAMGMMRTERHQGANKGSIGMVPLYALRYNLALMRRDEREKALVAFYGHMAQGMTRGTFIGGEGNRFQFNADEHGREFVLPPNSTSNAVWLIMLRYLFVQDWDLDEDGKPETLRLMYGVPRRWLADGQELRIENAPTAFGRMSLNAKSQLRAGYVEVRVTSPPRKARKTLLRAPLPEDWQVESAEIDGQAAPLIGRDTVELPAEKKSVTAKLRVKHTPDKR